MLITKQTVALQIAAHLRHQISLAQLIDWAEQTLMDAELDDTDVATLAAILARLVVSDVCAVGLTWEDYEDLLRQLGYVPRVPVIAVGIGSDAKQRQHGGLGTNDKENILELSVN